jgi:hypothetical protein
MCGTRSKRTSRAPSVSRALNRSSGGLVFRIGTLRSFKVQTTSALRLRPLHPPSVYDVSGSYNVASSTPFLFYVLPHQGTPRCSEETSPAVSNRSTKGPQPLEGPRAGG